MFPNVVHTDLVSKNWLPACLLIATLMGNMRGIFHNCATGKKNSNHLATGWQCEHVLPFPHRTKNPSLKLAAKATGKMLAGAGCCPWPWLSLLCSPVSSQQPQLPKILGSAQHISEFKGMTLTQGASLLTGDLFGVSPKLTHLRHLSNF